MKIALQAAASAVLGFAAFCALLFWPAGTFDYWQAWVFIAVYAVCTLVPSSYLLVTNPAALQRRMHAGPGAETRPAQRIIITGAFVLTAAVMVFSAVDHRFGWSAPSAAVCVAGAVLVAVGLALTQLVIIQNSYAAANITVEDQQHVVSSGLYGLVRHPMYVGVLIMMTGTPLALGSYWGLAGLIAGVPILVARISDEEKMLHHDLAGYGEYTRNVRYRLVPGVW